MKKTLLTITIVLLAACLPVFTVLADNGPHGGYDPATDACAGCHRAHSASASKLLIDAVPNLCFSCHGASATGADTDVEGGVYDGLESGAGEGTIGRGLKGGGFVNALMDTDWDGAASSTAVTSSHINDGSASTLWGSGNPTTTVIAGQVNFALSCTSCHDPHGGAGPSGGATYRLLRPIPTGSDEVSGEVVTDEFSKFYSISDNDKKSGHQYFGEGYNSPSTTWETMDTQESQLSRWCTQCHDRHAALTDAGSGDPTSGYPGGSPVDAIFTYRHISEGAPAGVKCFDCQDWTLPLPPLQKTTVGPVWNHYVQCMTCHVAHGTSASMSTYSSTVAWPDGTSPSGGENRSSLLRVDNRGVCQLCHGK